MEWTLEQIEQKRAEWVDAYAGMIGRLDAILDAEGKTVRLNGRYFVLAQVENITIARKDVLGYKAQPSGRQYHVWLDAKFRTVRANDFILQGYNFMVLNFLSGTDPLGDRKEDDKNWITPGKWMDPINKLAARSLVVIAEQKSQSLEIKAKTLFKRMALEIAQEI